MSALTSWLEASSRCDEWIGNSSISSPPGERSSIFEPVDGGDCAMIDPSGDRSSIFEPADEGCTLIAPPGETSWSTFEAADESIEVISDCSPGQLMLWQALVDSQLGMQAA